MKKKIQLFSKTDFKFRKKVKIIKTGKKTKKTEEKTEKIFCSLRPNSTPAEGWPTFCFCQITMRIWNKNYFQKIHTNFGKNEKKWKIIFKKLDQISRKNEKNEKLFSKNHIKFREKMKKTKIENIFQFLAFFGAKVFFPNFLINFT